MGIVEIVALVLIATSVIVLCFRYFRLWLQDGDYLGVIMMVMLIVGVSITALYGKGIFKLDSENTTSPLPVTVTEALSASSTPAASTMKFEPYNIEKEEGTSPANAFKVFNRLLSTRTSWGEFTGYPWYRVDVKHKETHSLLATFKVQNTSSTYAALATEDFRMIECGTEACVVGADRENHKVIEGAEYTRFGDIHARRVADNVTVTLNLQRDILTDEQYDFLVKRLKDISLTLSGKVVTGIIPPTCSDDLSDTIVFPLPFGYSSMSDSERAEWRKYNRYKCILESSVYDDGSHVVVTYLAEGAEDDETELAVRDDFVGLVPYLISLAPSSDTSVYLMAYIRSGDNDTKRVAVFRASRDLLENTSWKAVRDLEKFLIGRDDGHYVWYPSLNNLK